MEGEQKEREDQGAWAAPQPEVIPQPTYTPVGVAFGMVFLVWGLLTSPIVSVVGLIIFVASLAGWIGGILHERG